MASEAISGVGKALKQQADFAGALNARIQNGSAVIHGLVSQALAFMGIQQFRGAVLAAQDAAVAVRQLEQALRSNGQAVTANRDALTAQADALERLTGIEDEEIIKVQRLLLSFKASTEQVLELTPLVIDMAAALGTDAVGAARLLGSALDGTSVGLARYNITSKDLKGITKEVAAAFSGQAAAIQAAKGPLGETHVLFNQLRESVGKAVQVPVDEFLRTLNDNLKRLRELLDDEDSWLRRLLASMEGFNREVARQSTVLIPLASGLVLLTGVSKLLAPAVNLVRTALALLIGPLQALTKEFGFAAGSGSILKNLFGSGANMAARMTAAVELAGAATAAFLAGYSGYQAGKAIGQIKIFGQTIEDHIVDTIHAAQLAWTEFSAAIGLINQEEKAKRVAEILARAWDPDRTPSKRSTEDDSVPVAKGPSTEDRAAFATRMEGLTRKAEATKRLYAESREIGAQSLDSFDVWLDRLDEYRRDLTEQHRELQEGQKAGLIGGPEAVRALDDLNVKIRGVGTEIRKVKQESMDTRLKEFANEAERALTSFEDAVDAGLASSAAWTEWLKVSAHATAELRAQESLIRTNFALGNIGYLQQQERLQAVHEQHRKIAKINRDMAKEHTFAGRWKADLADFLEKTANVARDLADLAFSPMRGLLDGLRGSIEGLIRGTMDWGDALRNVATSVVDSVIKSFADMAANWITSHVLMKGATLAWGAFLKLFRKADAIDANATEASKSGPLATNATLASIGSWGVAVAIGLAAIAAILSSVGAFERGGEVAGGRQLITVNESGTETVMNARATRTWRPLLARLNAGLSPAMAPQANLGSFRSPGAAAPQVNVAPSALHLALINSREDYRRFLTEGDGRRIIIDTVNGARMELGMPG